MLYLEDYIEMIEQLPMDLKERFTEMREMDLQVQNSMDNIDEKVKRFFEGSVVKKLKADVKQQQYEQLRKEYYKVLEEADEKVQLANQIYDLVERYLRKLDQEVSRFKMELEADHAGITEVLERRSLELDRPPKIGSTKGEKRKAVTENNTSDKRIHTERLLSNLATEAAQEISGMKSTATPPSSTPSTKDSSSTSLSYTLGRVGAGSSNAIAMAAARAVTNTLQMQQGRRTASMKASFEAVKATGMAGLGALSSEFTYGGTTKPRNGGSGGSSTSSSSRSQSRRKNVSSRHATPTSAAVTPPTPTTPVTDTTVPAGEESNATPEWTYDPNEPRYCLCNQVSYGNMVGCDNPNCPIEWFHYGCVGITQPPKGKWFCPQCAAAMKRREKKDVPSKHK